ncbi:MAG: protein translocase subunit SecD [Sandaracinaceae bacterium]
MDRSWYVRFSLVVVAVLAAWTFLWPSLSAWVPAPAFLTDLIERRIAPGLDIRGGLRLMYTVEVDEAVRARRRLRADQILVAVGRKMDLVGEGDEPTRDQLEEVRERVRVSAVPDEDRQIRVTFTSAEDMQHLDRDLVTSFGDVREISGSRSDRSVTLSLTAESVDRLREVSVDQAKQTIEERIDGLGLREASVRALDLDVIVEVPGAQESDFDRIKEIISRTARLEFKIADDETPFVNELQGELPEGITIAAEAVQAGSERVQTSYLVAEGMGPCPEGLAPEEGEDECTARARLGHFIAGLEDAGRIPDDHQLAMGPFETDSSADGPEGEAYRSYYLFARADVTGDNLEDASVGQHPTDQTPVVNFRMSAAGARAMGTLTGNNVGRRMAIVLDDVVASAPNIESRISASGMITLGGMRDYATLLHEADDLVVVLRAGALPAPIVQQNDQFIGPTLGRDSVQRGAQGALIGVVLVLIFMAFYYQVAGLVADLMVVLNLLFLLAIMAGLGATLTLPGIAGIALTVGMAVDANVLITERIREELRMGKSARAAVDQGFRRAFWSIFDSQFTTFIAGVVLAQYGTGPIKGFANTLMIGIITSLFTGVFCSKVMFDWVVRGLRVRRLRVG